MHFSSYVARDVVSIRLGFYECRGNSVCCSWLFLVVPLAERPCDAYYMELKDVLYSGEIGHRRADPVSVRCAGDGYSTVIAME